MFYEILMLTPFLAIVSCITLGVAIVVVCTGESLPQATGFVVRYRRKIGPSVRARIGGLHPTGGGAFHRADVERCA